MKTIIAEFIPLQIIDATYGRRNLKVCVTCTKLDQTWDPIENHT